MSIYEGLLLGLCCLLGLGIIGITLFIIILSLSEIKRDVETIRKFFRSLSSGENKEEVKSNKRARVKLKDLSEVDVYKEIDRTVDREEKEN